MSGMISEEEKRKKVSAFQIYIPLFYSSFTPNKAIA
jgi:hypothetical protein